MTTMRRPITRQGAVKLGAGLVLVMLVACVAWGWFRGKPMPQAFWSTRILRRECIDSKDEPACVRACDRGVLDESGCLGAQQYERACRSGNIEGCREWQRAASREPALHASSKEYLASLAPTDHACELGHTLSCWQIAAAALGVDTPRAREALTRFCASKADDAKAECLREGEKRILGVDERAPVCARGDARACGDLAVLALEGNNEVLAGEALGNVCALRGLDALLGDRVETECRPGFPFPALPEGAKGHCAQSLIEHNQIVWRRNYFAPPKEEPNHDGRENDAAPLEPLPASTVPPKISLAKIEPVAMADALRPVIAAHFSTIERCFLPAHATRGATAARADSIVQIAFIVDRLGDSWLLNGWGIHHDGDPERFGNAIRCIVSRLRANLHVRAPLPEAVRVRAELHFGL